MHKKIVITTTVVIAIPVIIVIGLYTFITPNQYKPVITDAFYNATHRKLELNGDIKLKLFPYIGLTIKNAAIKNPEGFPYGNTVTINEVDVALELRPLLSHKINIKSILINGLTLNLMSNGYLNNWQFNTKNSINPNSQDNKPQKPFNLTMQSSKISNSSIHYSDLKTKKSYSLVNLNIDLPDINQTSFSINDNQIAINNLQFNLNDIHNGLLNLVVNNYSSNKLNYSGNLKIPEFSLNVFSKYLNINLPQIRNQKILDSFSTSFNFFGTANSINLNDIHTKLGSNTIISGNIDLLKLTSDAKNSPHIVKPLTLIINDKIQINKLDISDFAQINGFKLPLERIIITGKTIIPMVKDRILEHITLNQNINISKVTLLGASLRDSINKIKSLTNLDLQHLQKLNPDYLLKSIKYAFNPFVSKGKKDLTKQTNLGNLYTNLQIRNGILSTPIMLLDGPDLRTNANGIINLTSKYLDYNSEAQLKSNEKNDLISSLVFPVKIWGKTNNIQYKINWGSILSQIVNYQSKLIDGAPVKKSLNSIKQGAEKIFHHLFK